MFEVKYLLPDTTFFECSIAATWFLLSLIERAVGIVVHGSVVVVDAVSEFVDDGVVELVVVFVGFSVQSSAMWFQSPDACWS